jgi:hypothetical protein
MNITRSRTAALAALVLFSFACQQEPQAVVELPGDRLENPEMGLAIAAVPKPFEVVSGDANEWSFTAPGPKAPGELTVIAGPEESGGINLVDAIKYRKSWFEEAEGGKYHGNRELGGPYGAIFTARGTYSVDGQQVEETWAYAIHPGRNSLLSVRYTYPTGESGTRVDQLIEFLGEIEPLEVS